MSYFGLIVGGMIAGGAKAETLRSLGIRYLKLSPKSFPKPEDLRTLLYRM